MASIPVCVDSLLRIQEVTGRLHGVVGHSVGGMIAVQAATMGLQVERMVLIGTPARYETCARSFASSAGLTGHQVDEVIRVLDSMDTNVRDISIPDVARRLAQKALFIHSTEDSIVPISDGLESARAWPGAQFMQIQGFGHCRVLQAVEVQEAILEFLSNGYLSDLVRVSVR